ncbi:MAG TPA: cobalamin biosynthesis protein [Jatrophihabitans sp.]|jgi:adenosylcobinamide-phosphate synthase
MVLGTFLDTLVGDPRRGHPVSGYGWLVLAVERRRYADSRRAGSVFWASCVLPLVALAYVLERWLRDRPMLRTATVAIATWTVLGGSSLRAVAAEIARQLADDDLRAARQQIPSLCGRDPDSLDRDGLARAALESVAENTSDAVVGPLFWGAIAGVPGLLGYRAVNTLDAMVGHRSSRYARFGTVAARIDDLANLVPARLTAALTVAGAPLVSGSAVHGWRVWRADASGHPSPNAGRCEAAMAGVLGVQLGGRVRYRSRVEDRPLLGDGAVPGPADLLRSVRLARLVQLGALGVLSGAVAVGAAARALRRDDCGRPRSQP